MRFLSYLRRIYPTPIILEILDTEVRSSVKNAKNSVIFTVRRADPPGQLTFRVAVVGPGPIPFIGTEPRRRPAFSKHAVYNILENERGELLIPEAPAGIRAAIFVIDDMPNRGGGAAWCSRYLSVSRA